MKQRTQTLIRNLNQLKKSNYYPLCQVVHHSCLALQLCNLCMQMIHVQKGILAKLLPSSKVFTNQMSTFPLDS